MPTVHFATANGEANGYLARPAGDGGPGVLVLHPWWGLVDASRRMCDQLAAEGFVVFAPDLYGGETAATIEEAEALQKRIPSAAIHDRATRGLDYLRALPGVRGTQIGILGLSMGGAWAYRLAGEHPDAIGAVVTYYTDVEVEPGTRAQIIGHFGTADAFADEASIAQFVAQWQSIVPAATCYLYPGAQHWFAEPDRAGYYDAAAAELAWTRTTRFLASALAA